MGIRLVNGKFLEKEPEALVSSMGYKPEEDEQIRERGFLKYLLFLNLFSF